MGRSWIVYGNGFEWRIQELQPWRDIAVKCDFLREIGVEIFGVWSDADPPEVQTIRIPARSNRGVFMMMAIRVPGACVVK